MGFWAAGHVVYGSCVLVANIVMMTKFNNYTGWGEPLCLASMLVYYTVLFVENMMNIFPQVYLIFDSTFAQPMIWIGTVLTIIIAGLLEIGFYRWRWFFLSKPGIASPDQTKVNDRALD